MIFNKLKEYRLRHKYLQKNVARLMKLNDTSTISRWERGHSMPRALSLLKLSIIYNVTAKELYPDALMDFEMEVRERQRIREAERNAIEPYSKITIQEKMQDRYVLSKFKALRKRRRNNH